MPLEVPYLRLSQFPRPISNRDGHSLGRPQPRGSERRLDQSLIKDIKIWGRISLAMSLDSWLSCFSMNFGSLDSGETVAVYALDSRCIIPSNILDLTHVLVASCCSIFGLRGRQSRFSLSVFCYRGISATVQPQQASPRRTFSPSADGESSNYPPVCLAWYSCWSFLGLNCHEELATGPGFKAPAPAC